jgi:hypothetical protein
MNDRSYTNFHTSNSKGACVVAIKPEVNSEFREADMLFYILQRQNIIRRTFQILQINVTKVKGKTIPVTGHGGP